MLVSIKNYVAVLLVIFHVFGGEDDATCDTLEGLGLPYVQHITQASATASPTMEATFYNLLKTTIVRYWDNGTPEGHYQGTVPPGGESFVGTFAGHTFFFRHGGSNGKEVARFKMKKEETMYIVGGNDDSVRASTEYAALKRKQEWMNDYRKRTGLNWISYYGADGPREPPKLPIWQCDQLGQVHRVSSSSLYWHRNGNAIGANRSNAAELTLKVISLKPRVLLIQNLLSEDEADLIKELAKKTLHRSTLSEAGSAYTDHTRTSSTAWVSRDSHPVLNESVFPRFADVLKIDNSQLHHGPKGSAELLQVVHYGKGNEYGHHYDFFKTGSKASRYATLLAYLNDPAPSLQNLADGGTAFHRAFDGRGMKLRPAKGSAVLFYSMLPDGNFDPLSEHAGLPVLEGEKWVTNLWIWDPYQG